MSLLESLWPETFWPETFWADTAQLHIFTAQEHEEQSARDSQSGEGQSQDGRAIAGTQARHEPRERTARVRFYCFGWDYDVMIILYYDAINVNK